ncbi:glycosyltransferase family 2 protein [Candidatus Kaiserbacteria bacterium]|nr:glycosyltransferase family 2 protein [Candidatus Kaiserbacteria bacterium]
MKISFVIPAHNEEAMVGKCLQSVFDEIDRVHDSGVPLDVEVVVVDNASTDHTREEALKFPNVTVVEEKLKGLVYARRAGFVSTDGELVANIDSDTVLPRGWLDTVMTEFAKDPNLVALSGPFIYFDLSAWKRALVKAFYFLGWLIHLLNHHVFHTGAMLQGGNFILRRDAWEKAGGFDITIAFYGEDTDVARRIGKQGRVLWTWGLPMYTSGRRLEKEGLVRMSWLYTINHLAILWTGRPATQKYSGIRIEP